MREVLAEYRPAVVFHAAAYKHVAMMEHNPVEAIRNNALGTRLVARLCGELHVASFVLVSTDKAVEPATVMGASKALAEWAVEGEAATHPQTRYATVRFGNVLGSSGSVVPIFRRQIEVRRTGHRHRQPHDPFLHDDSRGRPADPARRIAARRVRRGVRARHGPTGPDHGPGPRDDHALRASHPTRTSRSSRSVPAPARSSPKTCSTTPMRRPSRPPRTGSCAPATPTSIPTGCSRSSPRSICSCSPDRPRRWPSAWPSSRVCG